MPRWSRLGWALALGGVQAILVDSCPGARDLPFVSTRGLTRDTQNRGDSMMKRIGAAFGFYALMLLCIGMARAQDMGPAKYFDMKEILDESTLNAVVASD